MELARLTAKNRDQNDKKYLKNYYSEKKIRAGVEI